ncbi:hypothetical protein BDV06DRAFT_228988 [Aspergillus oleicola]
MKAAIQVLANCFGYTWVTSYNTLRVIGADGINHQEAELWVETKINELNFTAAIGALVASVIATSLSWPGADAVHWIVTAFWYNGIVMAVVSAVMAFQQSSALGCVLAKIHNGATLNTALLGEDHRPLLKVVFVLQAPIQMLSYCISLYLLGLLVYIVYPTSGLSFDDPRAKIAIFCGVLFAFYLGFFITASVFLQRICKNVRQGDAQRH